MYAKKPRCPVAQMPRSPDAQKSRCSEALMPSIGVEVRTRGQKWLPKKIEIKVKNNLEIFCTLLSCMIVDSKGWVKICFLSLRNASRGLETC